MKKDKRKKRRQCNFCADKVECIDYKDLVKLRRYVTEKRQDPAPQNYRKLCGASASADRVHQKSTDYGFDALYPGIKDRPPSCMQEGFFTIKPEKATVFFKQDFKPHLQK